MVDLELDELKREFLAEAEEKIREIESKLSDRSLEALERVSYLAHQLKGSGGSLGFPRISDVARSMHRELNLFLDDERVDRPTPAELSRKIVALTDELAREVHSAACPASSSS